MRIWAVLEGTTRVSDVKQSYFANLDSLNGSLSLLTIRQPRKCVVCNESFVLRIKLSEDRLETFITSWQAERDAEMIYGFYHSDTWTLLQFLIKDIATGYDIVANGGQNRKYLPLYHTNLGSLTLF